MSFILDIYDGSPCKIETLENSMEIIGIATLGHDPDSGTRYFVQVALIQLEPFDEGFKNSELMFDIVENTRMGKITLIGNGLDTKSFLFGSNRRVALDICCEVTAALLEQRQPDNIMMQTSIRDLPNKALLKYSRLQQTIIRCSYQGGKSDSYYGQHVWMFVKC